MPKRDCGQIRNSAPAFSVFLENKALADLMLAGVRAGGGPYFYTSYRWGYGWAYGKGYADLTPEETAQADKLEKEYRAKHPALMCPE